MEKSGRPFKPAKDSLTIIGILLYGNKAIKGMSNNYYWYEKSFNTTRCLSLIAVLSMELGFVDKIEPMRAWYRYINM